MPQSSLGAYATCPLPFVEYSTLLGGDLQENGNDVAIDRDGRAYLAGTTFSSTFPAMRQARHGVDAISAVFDPTGSTLESTLWIDPPALNAEDEGLAIDIDSAGNRYFVGRTDSADFCQALGDNLPGFDTTFNGGSDGFLIKLDASQNVISCSFIGGDQFDTVRDVVVNAAGDVFLTGGTWSSDTATIPFPTTTSVAHAGLRDLFVMKFGSDGTLQFSTLLGGTNQEVGLGIAANAIGEAFVTGWSSSADLPTTSSALDTTANGGFDAFVLKLSADGTTHQYVTYLGGTDEDRAYAIALDHEDRAHVVGGTLSADFPITATAFQSTYNGVGFSGQDAFLTILSPDGDSLSYSTYIGHENEERAYDVAVSADDVYVTGFTQSAEFPTTPNAISQALNGTQDAFLLKFTNNQLMHSTFWGGSNEEIGNGLAIQNDQVYLVGESRSADFCTTNSTTPSGDYDIFLTKFDLLPHKTYLSLIMNQ